MLAVSAKNNKFPRLIFSFYILELTKTGIHHTNISLSVWLPVCLHIINSRVVQTLNVRDSDGDSNVMTEFGARIVRLHQLFHIGCPTIISIYLILLHKHKIEMRGSHSIRT